MDCVSVDKLMRILDSLLIEHFDTCVDNSVLEAIIAQVRTDWESISVERMQEILESQGIDDQDYDTVVNFLDDLNDKLNFPNLED